MSSGELRYIFLTDIARSSRLWEAFPQHYPALLEAHNSLTESLVAQHGGALVKHLGDGYIAVFETAPGALSAAVGLQLGLLDLPAFPDASRLTLRAVVHGGPLQQLAGQAGDWFGAPLNRSARIAAVAHPGQTLLSGFVRQRLTELPAELGLLDFGQVRLRDLGEPEQLYQVCHPGFAQRDFPPLLGMNARPNNLLEQPGAFVGREAELRELRRLLEEDDQRLITIVAPGGYGKSRLANQLCASLLHHYEDGVWAVELAPLPDSARIAEQTAGALGFQFFNAEEPRTQLLGYLRGKKLLLHFDNFEHVMDGASLVGEILQAAPGVAVIVTSRAALRLRGEQAYPLQPLGAIPDAEHHLPPAVELFADRAQRVQPDFRLDARSLPLVRELCARLDGVPLAVELAAAWADQLTPEELLSELGQQLDLTARMADVPERQRSVRASCDWSFSLLTEEQRIALMKLACFRGGFFAEAAQAVLGLGGLALRSMLAGLCDKSWLYTRDFGGQTRYSIRDAAAREYAWEKLCATRTAGGVDADTGALARGEVRTVSWATGEGARATEEMSLYEAAVLAHAQYFSELMAKQGPRLEGDGTPTGQREAMRHITVDLENISEAWDTLLNRLPATAEPFLPIVRWLQRYYDGVSAFHMLRERYDPLPAKLERVDACPQLGHLLYCACAGAARAEYRLGALNSAARLVDQTRRIAVDLEDDHLEALALLQSGRAAFDRGDLVQAKPLYVEALTKLRAKGQMSAFAQSLTNLGYVEKELGNFTAGRAAMEEAMAIQRDLGDYIGLAGTLNNLAIVEVDQGNIAAGVTLLREALALNRELGNRAWESVNLSNLAAQVFDLGEVEEARECLNEAERIAGEIGFRYSIISVATGRGCLEFGCGNFQAAQECFEQGIEYAKEVGAHKVAASALLGLALVHIALGELSLAAKYIRESLEHTLARPDPHLFCELVVALGEYLACTGDLGAAEACISWHQLLAQQYGIVIEPMERYSVARTQARLDDPQIGLPLAERERIQAEIDALGADEVLEFLQGHLETLSAVGQALDLEAQNQEF